MNYTHRKTAWVNCLQAIICFLGCGFSLAADSGDKLTLVKDGSPVASLVLNETPTAAAQLAAFELQSHIRLMTGALLPIIKEKENSEGVRIYIGDTAAATAASLAQKDFQSQEYAIKFHSDSLILAGKDAADFSKVVYDLENLDRCANLPSFWSEQGTLYAAYDFLEKYCGVRWFNQTENGTVCPHNATLNIKAADLRRQPGFAFRDALGAIGDMVLDYDKYTSLWPGITPEFKAWEAKAYSGLHAKYANQGQYNAGKAARTQLFLLRMRNGGEIQRCNHSFYGYFKRFWDDPKTRRPEMFAKGYAGGPTQLCYTSRELISQVAQDARDYYDGKKTGAELGIFWQPRLPNWFPLEPMDDRNFCKCPACQALIKAGQQEGVGFSIGADSDYFFTFVNEVTKELHKTHPDRNVMTLAYASHAAMPKNIKLDPNVAVQYCFASNRAGGASKDGYAEEIRLLREWAGTPEKRPLYLWLYYCFPVEGATNFNCFPGFFAHRIAEQMTLFKQLGVRGMFHCGFGQDVESYVTFKLMYDPEQNIDALLNDYFTGLYGAAAEPMKNLYLAIEKRYGDPAAYPARDKKAAPAEICWQYLGTAEFMGELETLLSQARDQARTETEKRNVELFDLAVWSYMKEGRKEYLQRQAAVIPAYKISRVPDAGGDVTKVAWDKAAPLNDWHRRANKDIPAGRKLSGRIAHDGKYLYLELIDDCDTSKLTSSPQVFPYDDWEVFVAGQRGLPYRQYATNPVGTVMALSHGEMNFRMNVEMQKHSCRVNVDVSAKDRWTTRLTWPLAEISNDRLLPGGKLYLNICRVYAPDAQTVGAFGVDTLVPFAQVHETARLAEFTLEK